MGGAAAAGVNGFVALTGFQLRGDGIIDSGIRDGGKQDKGWKNLED